MAHKLLIYHPKEAAEYARLVAAAGFPGPVATAANEEEAVRLAPAAEILLAGRIPAPALAAAGHLRWIQSLWAGVEQWLRLPIPPDVVLTRMVGPFGPLIAEYVFAHLLAYNHNLAQFRQQQAQRRWQPHRPRRLAGARLGVAGLGAIGGEIARRGQALGMAVWGLSRTGAPHPYAERVFPVEALHEFAAGVDYLVITLPNTSDTRHLFDAAALAAMRPGAVLVNVGRGQVVDEAALVAALREQRLGLAVLDVFETEPLPAEALWDLPNAVITPHCSGPSLPEDTVPVFMENYRRFAAGEPLLGVVDRVRGY